MIWLNDNDLEGAGAISAYPNEETKIEISPSYIKGRGNVVRWSYTCDGDLVTLMFVARHIRADVDPDSTLIICYMPYSRMDRVKERKHVFTLRYVADFIRSLGFAHLQIVEPHSDVCIALLHAEPLYVTEKMLPEVKAKISFDDERDFLVFPDAGAAKRYKNVAGQHPRILVGHKARNFETGQIDSLELVGEQPILPLSTQPKALIIDDLCSYGNTFIRTADACRALGINEVHLLVAHAEPAISKGTLFDHVDTVHATNSMDPTDPRITVYPLETL